MNWQPIETAPVGDVILLCNAKHKYVCTGYGEWMALPQINLPRWISCDPNGVGRFKPTHWMPLPQPPEVAE